VSGSIDNNVVTLLAAEEYLGRINGNTLCPLFLQMIEQIGKFSGSALLRGSIVSLLNAIGCQRPGIVEQAADQG